MWECRLLETVWKIKAKKHRLETEWRIKEGSGRAKIDRKNKLPENYIQRKERRWDRECESFVILYFKNWNK